MACHLEKDITVLVNKYVLKLPKKSFKCLLDDNVVLFFQHTLYRLIGFSGWILFSFFLTGAKFLPPVLCKR